MNGYTVCKHCLRTVKVTDGKLNRHVPANWETTCKGFKTGALWVDSRKLNATGRNSDGYCMRCERHVSEGPNLNCTQCCFERRNGCLAYDQKVKATVERLKDLGARVKVRTRKLAHREKTYLKIIAAGTHSQYLSLIMPTLRKDFPDAYMTSGGFTAEPWASDPHMNLTISLDPR